MTKIIIAIIVFNIVMGLIAKRRQKQAENPDPETLPEGQSDSEDAQQRVQAARAKQEAAAARAQSERETRDGRDERAAAAAQAAHAKKEKAVGVGKDILGQLAKELGLELPEKRTAKPAPRPQPAPAQPAKPAKAKAKPVREMESSKSRPSEARSARDEAHRKADARAALRDHGEHSREESETRGDNAPRKARAEYEAAPMGARVAGPMIGREELANPEAMRRAFILKTILDKPLSLRRPGSV